MTNPMTPGSQGMTPGSQGEPDNAGFLPPVGDPVLMNGSTGTGFAGDTSPAPLTPGHHELLRLCQRCSTQTVTDSETCPVCGSSYVRRPWLTKQRFIAISAVAALILLLGGGVAFARARQAQMAEEKRTAADQAADSAREKKAKEAADAADAERLVRASMVPGIEKSVTKMARGHASAGSIDGWPKSTTCSPEAAQSIDNLAKTTTKFSCFVTTERLGGGQARGHYYQALMNWETGSYTYGYAD